MSGLRIVGGTEFVAKPARACDESTEALSARGLIMSYRISDKTVRDMYVEILGIATRIEEMQVDVGSEGLARSVKIQSMFFTCGIGYVLNDTENDYTLPAISIMVIDHKKLIKHIPELKALKFDTYGLYLF